MNKNETSNADCLLRLVGRIDGLEARIKELEKPAAGYKCETCGIVRPPNWYIYEIEHDGKWLRPCCALCARTQLKNSRGPYPPNADVSHTAGRKPETEGMK